MRFLDQLVNTAINNHGEVRLPSDRSKTRRLYGPLAMLAFGLLVLVIRYAITDKPLQTESYKSFSVLILYVVVAFFCLPLVGTQVARFGERANLVVVFFKIFGLPFLFLGFLALLLFLSM